MSIKAGILSDDLNRQIYILREFPEILDKHVRNIMNADVSLLYDEIRPNAPAWAVPELRKRVTGHGVGNVSGKGALEGRVGWFGFVRAWAVNIFEYGAPPHKINSFAPGAGVYIKNHPGTPALGFMKAAYGRMRPTIEADMAVALENVVNELALK